MGRLDGKVALITGGGSGMGAVASELFAAEGARIVLTDVADDAGAGVADRIRDAGGEATYVHADVAQEGDARTMVEAAVCLANEMVGGADRLREDALAYAMMRMQFGKPIASFQSMKHKQADMLLEVELAKSAAYYAAASLDDGDSEAVANAHLAKACAGDTYVQTAIHAVQIHGGIGFTWDNDTHLWFKRAKSSEMLLGDANYHRELMLQNWPG